MHKLENCLIALKFIKEEGIPIISVGAEGTSPKEFTTAI
jgi:hypothetical protein